MTLLESLLDAIIRLEGDALVMHVGEKPYVVTHSSTMTAYRGPLAWGQVELSSRVLTSEAVMSMVSQLLPADQRGTLDQFGAIEHEIPPPAGLADRFTIVAARGGDDVWLELRRQPPTERPVVPTSHEAGLTTERVAESLAVSATAGQQQAPPAYADQSRDARSSAPTPSMEARSIEERVPVMNEVGGHPHEHVEHVLIAVAGGESRVGRPADPHETEFPVDAVQLIEPEAQHALTDEDVDAMLAETAAALLESEEPTSGDRSYERTDSEFVIIEHDQDDRHDPDAQTWIVSGVDQDGDESVDLTDALNEIPAQPWPGGPVEPAAAGESADEAGAVTQFTSLLATQQDESGKDRSVAGERRDWPSLKEESPPEVDESDEPETARPSIFPDPGLSTPSSEMPGPGVARWPKLDMSVAASAEPHETSAMTEQTQTVPGGATLNTPVSQSEPETRRVPVVPMSRATPTPDKAAPAPRVEADTLVHMLRTAAERGASTMYVVAQSKPMMRVDGEISALESGSVLTAADVERLSAGLAPSEVIESGENGPVEWISEVPEVGRVRCVTFRDHRGPGLIFRLVSARAISADHLGLPAEIRDLCTQTEGLVVVTGPRGSGRSTLLTAFVDLINRTRSDHIISIESQLGFVHDSVKSFVSQREVRGDAAMLAAVIAALREDPDVVVVDDIHSGDVLSATLDAAQSGRLVFACVTSPGAADAVQSMIELFPESRRGEARVAIATTLRAIVSQMLVRKLSGGRMAARELLLNTPVVATSILGGNGAEVTAALEGGARQGMIPLTDALASLVREGTVHCAEAYRKAPDRASLLAALARNGVDTSFAERLA